MRVGRQSPSVAMAHRAGTANMPIRSSISDSPPPASPMNDVAPTLDTPAVHPTYLRLLCQTLRSHGVDPEPVIHAVGLGSWAELAARDTHVTQRAVNALVVACERATGRPGLGLALGMAVPASAHGPMGVAAAAAATCARRWARWRATCPRVMPPCASACATRPRARRWSWSSGCHWTGTGLHRRAWCSRRCCA